METGRSMKRAIRVLSLVCAVCIPQTAPAAVIRNPDSVFGVVCPWAGIKDAGIKWVRCGAGCTALDWGAVEKERGVFDWKGADSEVYGVTKNEAVDLLPILGYTPKWASSGPQGESSYPPKELRDWSDFVYRMVDRYKVRIKYWEVWNEPDIGFWRGTIEDYADLLKSACIAAKKADPTCSVVFGGTAGVNLPFVERVYQNGGKYYFDVMAVHPYQWGDTFNDEWFCGELRSLHRLMEKYGDGHKEIWLTELGWSTGDKGITEEVQARLLAQAFITSLTLRDANVTKAFWFCVKDWGSPGHGLLRDDGSRKPAFEAYRFVSQALEGAEYIGPLGCKGLRCHSFRKDGRRLLAAWSPDKEMRTLELPDDAKWTALRRIAGQEESLAGKPVSITVGPEPVFVFSQESVPVPTRVPRKLPTVPYKLDVWYSVRPPEGTSRLYVVRGRPSAISVEVHNDSSKPVPVEITGRIGAFAARAEIPSMAPGETRRITLQFALPRTFKSGLDTLRLSGRCGGASLAPTSVPVRVADGPVIEFLANSALESLYLVEDKGSGGAPSVRFNGTWTYRFDLSKSKGGTLRLCVGAHQANQWRVLLSSDQISWVTAISGKSNRSWHEIDVSRYAEGPLFVKFEGSDQQLSELVLVCR